MIFQIFNRKILLLLTAIVLFCPAVTAGSAKSPTQYREGVQNALGSVRALLSPEAEEMTMQEYLAFESRTIKEIRAFLPGRETIEWEGASVETGNQWLVDKLDAFEKEPPDSPKRELILGEISERLSALELKLLELETAPAADRTKDEDKRKLAEILRREEYQKPEQQEEEEGFFQKAYREFMEWLQKMFPRPQIPRGSPEGVQSVSLILQIVLLALVLGLIGFLIYKFAPFFAGKMRTREKREKRERVILGEKLAADETPHNLFSEAERLAREGNLRGAIRKGYIALLCELSDKKIIGLAKHKTNRDYLRDVRKRRELYESLNGLTLNFERHWYGFDTADEKDWEEFRNGYKKVVS